jgi:RimJ/RimL family protein N-acetyltransferase
MNNPFQPTLNNQLVLLQPLTQGDFEQLYLIASDPLVWEQHPNNNRYQQPVFQNYFEGALQSKGALLIVDKLTGEVAGCSRFYDCNAAESFVFIGYTFLGRKFWGGGYNKGCKKLMLNHAFQYVNTVKFHIGATNFRSQIAIERLGALKTRELVVAYHGEPDRHNFEYEINKVRWYAESPDSLTGG